MDDIFLAVSNRRGQVSFASLLKFARCVQNKCTLSTTKLNMATSPSLSSCHWVLHCVTTQNRYSWSFALAVYSGMTIVSPEKNYISESECDIHRNSQRQDEKETVK